MLFPRPPKTSPTPTPRRRQLRRTVAVGGALAVVATLAACAGTPVSNPETSGKSGITVYGTADAGIGRVGR